MTQSPPTQTLSRPSAAVPRRPSRPVTRRPVQSGVGSALQVTGLGLLAVLLPVLLVWATDGRSGSGVGEVLRTSGQLWLVAHGASLEVPGGRLALTPLGLLALPLWLLARAGARRARERPLTSLRQVGHLCLATAAAYALVVLAVTVLAGTATVSPDPVSAVCGAFCLALVGTAAGALGSDRLWRVGWLRLPARGRRVARVTALTTAVLVAGGALLVGSSLLLHAGRLGELAGAGQPGLLGGLALLLLGLSLAGNAVVWAVAWLAGPGFAVGVGTAVGPLAHELGAVPAVPLLAALPGSAVPGWWGVCALAVPLLAGALAGRSVQRELGEVGLARTAAEAALAGPAAGALWLVLAWLSGGAVGGARLSEVGPAPLAVGVAVTVMVGAASAVSAVGCAYPQRRRAAV